jgi:bifunctional non-homologous end joining protein LigD
LNSIVGASTFDNAAISIFGLAKTFTSCRVLSDIQYIPPSIPTLRSAPPTSNAWIHEVKFDGWRIQLHKHGDSAAVFTKNGHDHSSRVRWMVDALACLKGVRSLVIDGEPMACDSEGRPDLWAFDLLHYNGRDLRT